jgi:uroporphyrinogen III methyltransferase / synthase
MGAKKKKGKPLSGLRIINTRSRKQAPLLSKELRDQGAQVLEIPTIKIAAPTNRQPFVEALAELNCYDWILFTSANGVTAFFDLFFKAFEDIRAIGAVRLAAVGPATAARLKSYYLKVDLMPDEFISSRIAEAFRKYQNIENIRILIMRAEVANPELPKQLEALGAIVDDIACYSVTSDFADCGQASKELIESGADWLSFASGSAVEKFDQQFGLVQLLKRHPKMKIATIGPETSKQARKIGAPVAVEAPSHTMSGLVKAIASY